MAKSKNKKRPYFSSTIAVLVIVFLGFMAYGIWNYGFKAVLDGSIFYIIGATFTALVILIVSKMMKNSKKIKLW